MESAKDTLKIKVGSCLPHLPLLLASLKNVIQDAIQGVVQDPEFGICRNWYMATMARTGHRGIASETYGIIAAIGMHWVHSQHPGEFHAFPIPRDDNDTYHRFLWKDQNLAYRLDLMYFTQGILEELIQENNHATG